MTEWIGIVQGKGQVRIHSYIRLEDRKPEQVN